MAIVDGSGTASGSTTLGEYNPEFSPEFNLPEAFMILAGRGTAAGVASGSGSSLMLLSGTGTVRTTTFLHGFPVVECVPLPVNAIVSPTKTFSYMQPLERGDLPIFISLPVGPVSPYRISYTLFEIRPDNSLRQAGASGRAPVPGVVGEYYATGRAGDLGQPGRWMIRWEFQHTPSSPVQVKEMCFRVEDAVLAKSPSDVTVRVQKYGWN